VIDALVRASAAFVGAEIPAGAERANLEAGLARMTAALAPRERRLLRLGLRVLDVLSRMRFLRPFAGLSDDQARRLLDALGASRLAALRRLHMSVRMMTQLAWYADPARWEECGYDGPWLGRVPVQSGRPPDLGPDPGRG
jgi:hypothetical protein